MESGGKGGGSVVGRVEGEWREGWRECGGKGRGRVEGRVEGEWREG